MHNFIHLKWKRALPALLALAAAARIGPFFLGYEHYGDAPVRIELAERWAQAPHLWHGFLETYQYGPLHLTLVGWLVRLLGDRVLAARLLSLASGLLCVWLLYRIAERERGREAALWAGLALALSPLHIQSSTTGASEAVFLALFLAALLLVLREQALVPALLLGAAGLVRYDGWLYVPLFAALLFQRQRDVPRALGFCALAATPAFFWMWVNAHWTGDALAPLHHIDREHARLAQAAMAAHGGLPWRLEGRVFWPFAVCVIATPLFGLFALWGSARTLRRREPGWELLALAWVPAAYFTFRTAVLADFWPMSRFAMVAAALSLVFMHDALERVRPPLRALAVAAAAATPLVLVALCWNRTGELAERVRPVAPIGSLPSGIAEAAGWLRSHVGAGDTVLLDHSAWYLDIPLAFASGLPDAQLIRASWKEDFEDRLRRRTPTLAVLLVPGDLGDLRADRFDFRGLRFCVAQRYTYATAYRVCAPGPATPRGE
ncbi:MAG: glycosyltransferase family 39 protein [Myxococcales bacterium]